MHHNDSHSDLLEIYLVLAAAATIAAFALGFGTQLRIGSAIEAITVFTILAGAVLIGTLGDKGADPEPR
jgi:hypothetical protein